MAVVLPKGQLAILMHPKRWQVSKLEQSFVHPVHGRVQIYVWLVPDIKQDEKIGTVLLVWNDINPNSLLQGRPWTKVFSPKVEDKWGFYFTYW